METAGGLGGAAFAQAEPPQAEAQAHGDRGAAPGPRPPTGPPRPAVAQPQAKRMPRTGVWRDPVAPAAVAWPRCTKPPPPLPPKEPPTASQRLCQLQQPRSAYLRAAVGASEALRVGVEELGEDREGEEVEAADADEALRGPSDAGAAWDADPEYPEEWFADDDHDGCCGLTATGDAEEVETVDESWLDDGALVVDDGDAVPSRPMPSLVHPLQRRARDARQSQAPWATPAWADPSASASAPSRPCAASPPPWGAESADVPAEQALLAMLQGHWQETPRRARSLRMHEVVNDFVITKSHQGPRSATRARLTASCGRIWWGRKNWYAEVEDDVVRWRDAEAGDVAV